MGSKNVALTNELYEYIFNVSSRETPALQSCREQTSALGEFARQHTAVEQGQFIALQLKLMGAKRVMELGTFTGYGTLWMALALPYDGYVLTCDVRSDFMEIAQSNWARAGVSRLIEFKQAAALDVIDSILPEAAGTFDFIYIDADKANYPLYYEHALTLLRQGGMVVIDNVLRGGGVIDQSDQSKQTKVIKELNNKLTHDQRVDISIVLFGDGMTLARKR